VKKLQIYTDGACSGNPGPGGWAAVLLFGDAIKEISGYEPDTTNNRMELQAVIEGLRAVKRDVPTEVHSDSSYFVNAVTKGWLDGWRRNGWRTSDKKDVKNRDLWEEFITLHEKINPQYFWVKGHADNKWNNRCDELAVAEIKRRISKTT